MNILCNYNYAIRTTKRCKLSRNAFLPIQIRSVEAYYLQKIEFLYLFFLRPEEYRFLVFFQK